MDFSVKFKVNSVLESSNASAAEFNWAEELLNLDSAWKKSTGRGIKVAVLDTGVDVDHPDLRGAIAKTMDFTGEGVEDGNGHGTHCAGIIGARRNNIGFSGVAPDCQLYIAKVLGNKGNGAYSWIVNGINWAVQEDVDIISMSLGGPADEPTLFTAIHNAIAKNKIVVCAAGNEGSLFSNTIGFPGRYGSVLTIASHDENGNRSGFSSRGGEIDFMAPGSNIWSTYKNGTYASLSGTSMATPFVAGLCALILAADKSKNIKNISCMRNELMKIASHPGYHDSTNGYGPLNPFKYFYS